MDGGGSNMSQDIYIIMKTVIGQRMLYQFQNYYYCYFSGIYITIILWSRGGMAAGKKNEDLGEKWKKKGRKIYIQNREKGQRKSFFGHKLL